MKRTPFERLIHIMSMLRSPEGCPWDREQTPESLIPYIAEEACETIEAIAGGDTGAICEELGDLLLQVVFQSQIFQERDEFTIDDVITSIITKLERRHPHVFGDHPTINCPEEQSRLWEKIKTEEKSNDSTQSKKKTSEPPTSPHQPTCPPALHLTLNVLQHAAPLPHTATTDNLSETLNEIISADTTLERNTAIDSMILLLTTYRNSEQ